jgi:dihydrofolate reductase
MSKVVFDISMSLDGFVRAANARPDEPMGDGGQRLHEWAFGGSGDDREVVKRGVEDFGAFIAGRRTFDDSLPWWGPNGPTGDARLPLIVVTHSEPDEVPADSVYAFATGGIERALQQARATAGDKNVAVMGGADIGQQFIRAGLVDEIGIHLVPVLFGSGLRMFEHIGGEHIHLESIETINTPAATHLRYRVVT